jgi:hypothetical protein
MARVSEAPLNPNPFITYRDPQTGLWVVVKQNNTSTNCSAVPCAGSGVPDLFCSPTS